MELRVRTLYLLELRGWTGSNSKLTRVICVEWQSETVTRVRKIDNSKLTWKFNRLYIFIQKYDDKA